jgi:hypothetical protein
MENKDLTAGEREVIFILKNENKTYVEFTKLLKIYQVKCLLYTENFSDHLHFHPIKTRAAVGARFFMIFFVKKINRAQCFER